MDDPKDDADMMMEKKEGMEDDENKELVPKMPEIGTGGMFGGDESEGSDNT
jgi:hypothetical protein